MRHLPARFTPNLLRRPIGLSLLVPVTAMANNGLQPVAGPAGTPSIGEHNGVPVIDIRTEGEWKQTGIVAGSRLLTCFDERGRADPATWLARVKPIAAPDRPVVVICRTGNRTGALSEFLDQRVGYKTVYNVKQGIQGWMREGRPVVPAAPVLAACTPGAAC